MIRYFLYKKVFFLYKLNYNTCHHLHHRHRNNNHQEGSFTYKTCEIIQKKIACLPSSY